jgi:hypothetical protein
MLNNTARPNGQALRLTHQVSGLVNTLSGSGLRRILHGKSAKKRAATAARLIKHGVSIEGLNQAQAARLCQVNESAVCAALGHTGSRGAHQRTIDRLVKKYGPDTLMKALDRATTPSLQAAE